MASLAAMLKEKGYNVYGTDENLYPPMSTFLKEQQIPVYQDYDIAHLEPKPDLVIVGNVISRGNIEIEEILARHLHYISLPDALREFLIRGKRSIVVTGTHGKTTTTSLVAWIYDFDGRDPGFMIGGIPLNFERGYQVGTCKDFIIEGDEYDSAFFDKAAKFLRYMPDVGIINNIEFDHADIYKTLDEIKIAFKRFVNLIPKNGLLLVSGDNDTAMEISTGAFCPVETFGLSPASNWQGRTINMNLSHTKFDVFYNGDFIGNIMLPLPGEHNIRNALAAIAVAHHAGINFTTIRTALQQFKGIKRRLELKGTANGIEVFDDLVIIRLRYKKRLPLLKAFIQKKEFLFYMNRVRQQPGVIFFKKSLWRFSIGRIIQ